MGLFKDLLTSFLKEAYKNFSILSPYFYIALTLLVVVYYTLAKKLKMQWVLLLAASLFFYLVNGRKAALWMFLPVAVTYFAAHTVTQLDGKIRPQLSALVVLFNVLFLVYFKEANFFIKNANRILGFLHLPLLALANRKAPFGVSYITLMLISYYLDVSWQQVKPQKNPLKFVLYALFFPVTTSGPIARYTEVESQLLAVHRFDYERFCFGVQRIVWGFFKKLVIAERIGAIVGTVYGNWSNYAGFTLALGLLLYALQVYADFSGCIDMVLGAAETLGIALPENFRQPLFSTSLSEIWRRWHMTLGFWVKDYVLYPVLKSGGMQRMSVFLKDKLGKKNRYAKMIPTWCGMAVTWFTVGFWHGGDWKYIFGGGLFFFAIITGGQLLEPLFARLLRLLRVNTEAASWRLFQRLRTYFLFAAVVSFQRAASLKTGLKMWRRVFKDFNPWIFFDGTLFRLGLDAKDFFVMVIGLLIVLLVSNLEQGRDGRTLHVREALARQNLVFRWLIYLGLVLSVVVFGMYGPGYNPAAFIYFQF
ncbi:MAG: MBOAT family protein [Treponema sp.]|nr:MBOAT family protein [Treponema sp.]